MAYFTWNGKHIHYRENGAGELLLILPGNTASSICHQGELDHFGKAYHAVAIDFLGTGKSDRESEWSDN